MQKVKTFKIFIVYDHSTAAIRAKQMAERLAGQLDSECDVCPFEWLALERVRGHAAFKASLSNMVIVTIPVQEELPDCVKDWIECWLQKKNSGPTALVALLDEDEMAADKPSRSCAYLQRIAERGNMDFFCNLELQKQPEDVETGHYQPDSILEMQPEALPEYATVRGWGINE